MPSSITHELIARDAITLFPKELQRVCNTNYDYYILGAQGPDVYFFYRFLQKKEINLGKYMHRNRTYDVFTYFKEHAKEERILAYVVGFVVHYATDATFHPLVYALLDDSGAYKMEHQQIENDWDVFFERRKREMEVTNHFFPFSSKRLKRENVLYEFLNPLMKELSRKPLKKGKMRKGVKTFCLYNRFFHGKHCYEHQRRFDKMGRFFHTKRKLARLFPRENPNEEYLSGEKLERFANIHTVSELYDRAVQTAGELCNTFYACAQSGEPLPKELFNKSYLTAEQQ